MFLTKSSLQNMSIFTTYDLKHFLLFSQLTGKLNLYPKNIFDLINSINVHYL